MVRPTYQSGHERGRPDRPGFREQSRRSSNPAGDVPEIASDSYVDPAACVIGRVILGRSCFVAPHAVIRSDEEDAEGRVSAVRIGDGTNVQDGVVIHALAGSEVDIAENVSLAHGSVVHGPCAVGRGAFVGFGAVVFRATIGSGSMIGHRAVVTEVEIPEGRVVPAGEVVSTEEAAAALDPVDAKQHEFMEEVSLMNRELARSYGAGGETSAPAQGSGSMGKNSPTGENAPSYRFLSEKALSFGADSAAFLAAEDVVVDERVRLKCAVPQCQGYGHYLTCPPNTMSVDEFRKVLARYSTALVVQVESKRDSSDLDEEGLAGKNVSELEEELHGDQNRLLGRIMGLLEAEAFKAGLYYAAGFTGGICILCPECVGVASGEPCRRPFEARPAMEGVGIDVAKTAAAAGLPMALSSDEPVRWTGLLLVD